MSHMEAMGLHLRIEVRGEQHRVTVPEGAKVSVLRQYLSRLPGEQQQAEMVLTCDNVELADDNRGLLEYGVKQYSVVKAVPRQMGVSREERYYKVEKVGEGTYGVVYKARDTVTNTTVAMKRVRGDIGTSEGIPSSAMREVSALRELDHPNVVKLKDILNQPNRLYLVFEFVDQDLKKYLDSRTTPLPATTLKKYVHQLVSAVEYCHGKRIIHRDLKPQNILVTSDRGQLKIADFGLARDFQYPVQTYTQETVTLWYRAPELLLGAKRYAPDIDMWSIGCVYAEMACRRPLFTGDCEIGALYCIFRLMGTPYPDVWKDVTSLPHHNHSFPSWRPADLAGHVPLEPLGIHLLKRMLAYDPKLRITPAEALRHPYFNVHDEAPSVPLGQEPQMVLAP